MQHSETCHCRRCNNRRHNRLVSEFKLAVSRHFGADVYVDDVVQYHGQTVRNNMVGPWIDAGMARGTFDLFCCVRGAVVFLDAKTGGGKLTDAQLDFRGWIRRAGGTAEPIRSVEEGIAILERVMGGR